MNEYRFEDLTVGMEEQFEVTVTDEMMDHFRELSGDCNPLHTQEAFAKRMGYGERVVSGMLTASFLSTLAGVYLPGKYSLIHQVETEFPGPVHVGDVLQVSGRVTQIQEAFRCFTMKTTIKNQQDKKVLRGKMRVGFLEEQQGE